MVIDVKSYLEQNAHLLNGQVFAFTQFLSIQIQLILTASEGS